MSTESERVFSQSTLTVTPSTTSTLGQTPWRFLELLRHWWRNNIIKLQRGGNRGVQNGERRPQFDSDGDVAEAGRSAIIYPFRNTEAFID
jgi:hypothetical protein